MVRLVFVVVVVSSFFFLVLFFFFFFFLLFFFFVWFFFFFFFFQMFACGSTFFFNGVHSFVFLLDRQKHLSLGLGEACWWFLFCLFDCFFFVFWENPDPFGG